MTDPAVRPEYLTTAELCARLSICRRTVANHGLRAYALQVGGQWRYDWTRVLQHYKARTTTGKQGSAGASQAEVVERPVLEASAPARKHYRKGGRARP